MLPFLCTATRKVASPAAAHRRFLSCRAGVGIDFALRRRRRLGRRYRARSGNRRSCRAQSQSAPDAARNHGRRRECRCPACPQRRQSRRLRRCRRGASRLVRDRVFGIEGGPLVSLAVATNVLASLTGSASGGLTTALDALGATYLKIADTQGITPGSVASRRGHRRRHAR